MKWFCYGEVFFFSVERAKNMNCSYRATFLATKYELYLLYEFYLVLMNLRNTQDKYLKMEHSRNGEKMA